MIILSFIYLILGLILLWIFGDLVVKYTLQASHLFGISTLFIGFAIISIMTGLPEFFILIESLQNHTPYLSAGNLLGSSFFNITLVLGLPAFLVAPIEITGGDFIKNITIFGITALLTASLFIAGEVYFLHSLVLLFIYIWAIIWIWHVSASKKVAHASGVFVTTLKSKSFFDSKLGIIIKLLVSIGCVSIAAEICVNYILNLAHYFNITTGILGSTILAFGSVLPEMILSIKSIRSKQYELVIGTAFGSILTNSTLFLAILALGASPLDLKPLFIIMPFIFCAYSIVGYSFLTNKRLGRIQGLLLVLIAFIFLIYQGQAIIY